LRSRQFNNKKPRPCVTWGNEEITKLFFATLAVVLLAGCLQTAPVQKRLTEADDPSGDCFSALESDPKLAVLIPKIGAIARPDRATIEQMASKEKPTSEAKQAISAWGVSR